ncbi:hypothetical protein PAXRUDRAFT_825848 [Paxillus rubicundulus Ve08.2h10]|uniref:Unplaced genomic scaffold scaffold_159, whole genome shotgun sequence n=1 Tax=Paxillus rubicundulus Ve08.2h10 TaxID=930991 RepID=A0A0D0EAE6_9AGAM|nr:hypothetical protein PAXRUDRAFT_825848 [Paxillus rubicundulus Ve08.2h10]
MCLAVLKLMITDNSGRSHLQVRSRATIPYGHSVIYLPFGTSVFLGSNLFLQHYPLHTA